MCYDLLASIRNAIGLPSFSIFLYSPEKVGLNLNLLRVTIILSNELSLMFGTM